MPTIHSPSVNETGLVVILNQVACEILVLLGKQGTSSGHTAFARYSPFPAEIVTAEDVGMSINTKVRAGRSGGGCFSATKTLKQTCVWGENGGRE